VRPRIATLDGTFVLDPSTGFYEPEPIEPEEHYRHRRTIWLAMLLASWALTYLLYLAAQAWLG
jgi:hypothetical protein